MTILHCTVSSGTLFPVFELVYPGTESHIISQPSENKKEEVLLILERSGLQRCLLPGSDDTRSNLVSNLLFPCTYIQLITLVRFPLYFVPRCIALRKDKSGVASAELLDSITKDTSDSVNLSWALSLCLQQLWSVVTGSRNTEINSPAASAVPGADTDADPNPDLVSLVCRVLFSAALVVPSSLAT